MGACLLGSKPSSCLPATVGQAILVSHHNLDDSSRLYGFVVAAWNKLAGGLPHLPYHSQQTLCWASANGPVSTH
jgi:hypothetical protein